MKKTITLFAMLLLALTMTAEASQLILRVPTGQASLAIQGQQYFTNNGEFLVRHLQHGKHFIAISSRTQNRNQHRNRQGRAHPNQFRGKIFIPRGSKVFARITPNGRLVIDQVIPIRQQSNRSRTGAGRDFGRDGYNPHQPSYNRTPVNRSQVYFTHTLRRMELSAFDSDKLRLAKQYLRQNGANSRQVIQLMRRFDFESTRLSLAKYAYTRVIDPQNFYLVYDGFEFRSSARALDRFIYR